MPLRRGGGEQTKVTTLLFVDLAGSERTEKTGVEGSAKSEAQSINSSLSALGRVIKSLGAKQGHVPYRDTALTMLLRDSFGGKSCTSVVISVVGAVYKFNPVQSTHSVKEPVFNP